MSKKLWGIVVNNEIEPEIRKKIKRLLQPVDSVRQPAKCYFCETMTTWTINKKNVCPVCSVKYCFIKECYIPDACEVCGKQGEWCTEGDLIHSLCYIHRDAWFKWDLPELKCVDSKKEREKWLQVWDEGWNNFVATMKTKAGM